MSSKVKAMILYVVVFVALWNLIDFIMEQFITRSGFSFSVVSDLVMPAIIGAACGLILFKSKKKK